jgi:capsular polysaccharide biosynthesis protein
VRLEGPWTSVVSWWSDGFYHWFMDVLPRLALLGEFPPATRILVPPLTMPCQVETLDWLGVREQCVPTTATHLRVEDYFFSSPTAMTGGSDARAVEFLRSSFLGRADTAAETPRKVFVHRAGGRRGLVNESDVLDFMTQRGWTVVDTAALPMARQISLFAGADAVCGLHGAGLANLLWCRAGCRVFELAPSNYLNGAYEGLAALVSAHHQFLVCEATADFKARVDLKELGSLLAQ